MALAEKMSNFVNKFAGERNEFNINPFTRSILASTDSSVTNAQLGTSMEGQNLGFNLGVQTINQGDGSSSGHGLKANIGGGSSSGGYSYEKTSSSGGTKHYSQYSEHEMKSQVAELLGNKRNNHLSGGVLDETSTRTWSGNLGANQLNGGVNVGLNGGYTSKTGDLYDNSSWGLNANFGFGSKGAGGVRFEKKGMWGETSASGFGYSLGVGTNTIGTPEMIADLNYVKDGVKWTFPIGGIATNILTGNKAGLAMNVVQMVNPEKLPIPQNEIILPDSKPKMKTHVPMFEKDTVELSSAGLNYMKVMIANSKKVLEADPNAKIELGNYHDEGYFNITMKNEKENTARQEFVKRQLIEAGIPADKIIIGHSNVSKNDVDMTIQDQYTNVRFKTNQSVALQDAVSRAIGQFEIERASPANMEKLNQVYNSAEFKAFTNGKSDLEIEYIKTAAYHQHYVQGKPLNELFSHIQENYYDKGVTLSKAAQRLSDEEVMENIKKSEPYQAFIAKNPQITQDKDEETALLSKMVQSMKDIQYQMSQSNDERALAILQQSNNVETMLAIYQTEMIDKGHKIKNEKDDIKALQDELKEMKDFAKKFVNSKGELNADKAIELLENNTRIEVAKFEKEKRKNGDRVTQEELNEIIQQSEKRNINLFAYAGAIAGKSDAEIKSIDNHLISFAMSVRSGSTKMIDVADNALKQYINHNLSPEIREAIANNVEQNGGLGAVSERAGQDRDFAKKMLESSFTVQKEYMTKSIEQSKAIRGVAGENPQAKALEELKENAELKAQVKEMLATYKGVIANGKKEEENIYNTILNNPSQSTKETLMSIEQLYQSGKSISQVKIEQELATVKGGVKAQIQGNIEQAEVAKQAPQTVEVQAQAVEAPKEKVVNIANIEQTNQQFKQDEEMKLQQQAALKQQQEQELSNSQKHTF